jgi:hypothetical protein
MGAVWHKFLGCGSAAKPIYLRELKNFLLPLKLFYEGAFSEKGRQLPELNFGHRFFMDLFTEMVFGFSNQPSLRRLFSWPLITLGP